MPRVEYFAHRPLKMPSAIEWLSAMLAGPLTTCDAQAIRLIEETVTPVGVERCAFTDVAGRILAEPLHARCAAPRVPVAAMDGYAVLDGTTRPGEPLTVVGESRAGSGFSGTLSAGQAVRIFTGAPIPPGADAVVPVELTDQPAGSAPLPERVRVLESVPLGRHIRPAADNLAAGDVVLDDRRAARPAARTPATAAPDPIAREVYGHRFMAIATQMGAALERTATSVNIRERRDFSCALFDATGELIANAPHVPVHLGAMGETVRALLAAHPAPPPGTSYACNDPAAGDVDQRPTTPVGQSGMAMISSTSPVAISHPRYATSTAPAAISATPAQLAADSRSPRNTTPNTATSTTLSLSMGATLAASPSFSARK